MDWIVWNSDIGYCISPTFLYFIDLLYTLYWLDVTCDASISEDLAPLFILDLWQGFIPIDLDPESPDQSLILPMCDGHDLTRINSIQIDTDSGIE